MADLKSLVMGVDSPNPSPAEREARVATLEATVTHYIPEFAKTVAKASADKSDGDSQIMLHQDAFAAGYDDDEYTLFGMALKYAGLHGVTVTIICTPASST